MGIRYYVLTPAGKAGPYKSHADARDAAHVYGNSYVIRERDCEHAPGENGACVHCGATVDGESKGDR